MAGTGISHPCAHLGLARWHESHYLQLPFSTSKGFVYFSLCRLSILTSFSATHRLITSFLNNSGAFDLAKWKAVHLHFCSSHDKNRTLVSLSWLSQFWNPPALDLLNCSLSSHRTISSARLFQGAVTSFSTTSAAWCCWAVINEFELIIRVNNS